MKYYDLTISRWFRSALFMIALFTFSVNQISAQQPCSLACNGSTQVSTDENCEALITPDMILNDQTTSCPGSVMPDDFDVTVSNLYGEIDNPITSAYIGQDLYVKVTDLNSGNSCWGNITLEDKLGPIIESCPTAPIEVACSDLSAYEGPVYFDPCEGYKEPVLLRETITPLNCDPVYVKTVTRVYTAYDSKNNAAPECTIVYNLLRIDFDDVNCPYDYTQYNSINSCAGSRGSLSCDGKWRFGQYGDEYDTDLNGDGVLDKDVYWDDNGNNYPDPEEVGVPTMTTNINGSLEEVPLYPFPDVYCNAVVTFNDIEYPRIGCTKKIVRLWIFREWHCNDEVLDTIPQVIEIVDDIPPVLECPGHITTTTNTIMGATNTHYGSVTCGANTDIPLPDATDNCSTYLTYDITYPGGFESHYDGTYPVLIPMGVNEVVFTVYDECYNSSSCTVLVDVQDNTPPVTVCDQYTAVSLTTGGEAVVNAYSFDDGSYDDCKTHCMLVQRMTPDDCDCKIPEFCGMDYIGSRDGSYYYMSSYEISAGIAKNRANAYGGSVVIFDDYAEEQWLLNQVRPTYGDRFWIGMKRFGNGFLWDDHTPLSYTNWSPGNPSGTGGLSWTTVAPNYGNTILVADGAQVNNFDDMVSNLRLESGPTSSTVDIHWNWYAPSTGSYTEDDGINMKLLHYDGSQWRTIYTERYSGTNTTNTIAPYLDKQNNGFYRFHIPENTPCGTNYFRIAIEDNSFEWDVIQGNFGTNDDSSHYDNADVAFTVASEQCSEDCVMMTPTNQWNDASCYIELPYILEIKDICGFSEIANFCCSDVGTDQMVTFRVVDIFGNFNDCMVNVDVQDKVAPSLICPPNTTVDCDAAFDPNNLDAIYGVPVLSDDCGATVSEEGINDLSSCNLGTYTRVFTATDDGGRTSTCKQVLTFLNPDPFTPDYDIECPADVTIVGCMAPEDLGPDVYGYPEFINERCGLLGTDWDDEVFTFNTLNGDACFKILRTWEVIDWCQPNMPVFSCVQVIKVTNGDKPIITGCEAQEVCTFDSECLEGFIELEVSASDSCTSSENLRWRYEVYAGELGVGPKSFSNPVREDSGDGPIANASGTYPIGSHIVRWTFFDRCGNATTCDQEFTIANCKAPTAYCINGLAVDLMPMDLDGNGEPDFAMVELWASDFDAGSHHVCGYEVELSFSPDSLVPNITFDCTTRGDQDVNIYASIIGYDGERITSFCTSTVNVQDNNEACMGQMPTVNVGGNIFTEELENLSDVEVKLIGSPLIGTTDDNGEYAFPDMPMGGDYIVSPYYNEDPLNGVSTLDIIEIQRHLLGLEPISSPYKLIAADVNRDYRISTLDLLELRKLILGIYNEFPDNDSWRFVDNAYDFIDPYNPLNEDFKESYLISKLETDMDIDFVAVKIGDVNDNAVANAAGQSMEIRESGQTALLMDDVSFEAGENISVPVEIGTANLRGMQMALEFDPNVLDIISIDSENGNFGADNYRILEDKVLISWNANVDYINDTELFTINAVAKSNARLIESIAIGSEALKAEMYDADGNISQPVIKLNDNGSQFALYQNTPNPFTDMTNVSFVLEQAGNVNIVISDVQGRTVKQVTEYFNEGNNTYVLGADEIGEAGIYYLTMNTDRQSATIKMVVIR